jgi:glycosyltransferase involved in cell wall biosynthesis
LNIYWYTSDTHAPGYVRGEIIAREVNRNSPNHLFICKTDMMSSDLFRANIMIFQRQFSPESLERMRLAKSMGIRIIYDIDDDMWNIPESMGKVHDFYTKQENLDGFSAFVQEADFVTTSTIPLAKSLKARFPDVKFVFVVENAVDYDFFSPANIFHKKLEDRDEFIVGWFGSTSHKSELTTLEPVIKRAIDIVPNIKFSLAGNFDKDDLKEDYGDKVEFHGWLGFPELKNWMACLNVGLCLIDDHPFNNCKSQIKWCQNAAVGVPSICSDAPAYACVKDGETGFKVNGIADEKLPEMLQFMEANRKELRRVGINAMEEVQKNHNSAKKYLNWIKMCDRVMQI